MKATRWRVYRWLRRHETSRWHAALMAVFMREDVERLIDKTDAVLWIIARDRDKRLRHEGWIR